MKYFLFFLAFVFVGVLALSLMPQVKSPSSTVVPEQPPVDMVTLPPDLKMILLSQHTDIEPKVIDAYIQKVTELNKEFEQNIVAEVPPSEERMKVYAARIEAIKKELGIDIKMKQPTGNPAAYLPPPLISIPSENGTAPSVLPTVTPPLQMQEKVPFVVPPAAVIDPATVLKTETPPLQKGASVTPAPQAAPVLPQ